jgi:hypothetical protein
MRPIVEGQGDLIVGIGVVVINAKRERSSCLGDDKADKKKDNCKAL